MSLPAVSWRGFMIVTRCVSIIEILAQYRFMLWWLHIQLEWAWTVICQEPMPCLTAYCTPITWVGISNQSDKSLHSIQIFGKIESEYKVFPFLIESDWIDNNISISNKILCMVSPLIKNVNFRKYGKYFYFDHIHIGIFCILFIKYY